MTEQSLTPSPVIESLLTGLGARAEITAAVLGDLHEKLTVIAAARGIHAARRWYRREALRAAPHLLLDGVRSLRFADARRLLNVGLLSVTLTAMLAAMAFFGGMAVMMVFTDGLSAPDFPFRMVAGAWVVGMVLSLPILAGFLAATLEEKAPLLAAMTIAAGGVAWTLLLTGLQTRSSETMLLNLGFPYAGTLWVTIGCAIGGMLRVGRGDRARRLTSG